MSLALCLENPNVSKELTIELILPLHPLSTQGYRERYPDHHYPTAADSEQENKHLQCIYKYNRKDTNGKLLLHNDTSFTTIARSHDTETLIPPFRFSYCHAPWLLPTQLDHASRVVSLPFTAGTSS